MPRAPRIDLLDLLHHVIVRGIEQRDIFIDDEDRTCFLDRFGRLLQETSTRCFAWAMMRNHVHLLVSPSAVPLSTLMRRLLTGYAVTFNRKHSRSGHLFQNRYKSILCEEEPYFLELVRYIHLNPLRCGAVATFDELDNYRWTGHAAIMGKKLFPQDISAVLERFGHQEHLARCSYRHFVKDGVALGQRKDLVGGGLLRSQPGVIDGDEVEPFDERVLGGGAFVEELQKKEIELNRRSIKTPLPELVRQVCLAFDLEEHLVLRPSKNRKPANARAVACYLAVREHGYKSVEVGKVLNLGSTGVTLAVRRGERLLSELDDVRMALRIDK